VSVDVARCGCVGRWDVERWVLVPVTTCGEHNQRDYEMDVTA